MIKSRPLFETLEKHTLDSVGGALPDIMYDCVRIKKAVVEADEFDVGERMLLNFGHTLGHAIEKLSDYSGVSHGRAVAAGMALITRAAERSGDAVPGLTARLSSCLERYGLDADVPFSPREAAMSCRGDKKRDGGDINIVICNDVGSSYVKNMRFDGFLSFI
jgi:3-dehydroquinate synthase